MMEAPNRTLPQMNIYRLGQNAKKKKVYLEVLENDQKQADFGKESKLGKRHE